MTMQENARGTRLRRLVAVMVAALVAIVACHGTTRAFAAGGASSSDLRNHVTQVDVEGGDLDGDVITVRPGTELQMTLHFKETRDMLFDRNSVSYKLPSGFDYGNQSGTFRMGITDTEGDVKYLNVPYTIEDGVLTVTWPKDDPNYQLLKEVSNARFNISFRATFENADGKVDFGNGVTKTFKINQNHDVDVKKDGYVGSDGKIHYTVTVTSTGRNSSVEVKDVISGTALTYDAGSFAISGNSSTPTGGTSGNGFDITLPSMKDGEKAVITYTASIDYSKITSGGTKEETQNDVTATVPGKDPKQDSKSFEHQINWTPSSIGKSGKVADKDRTSGNKTFRDVTWTIDANPQKLVSLAGKTIGDRIADDSKDVMKYSGKGISIEVYKEDGSLLETRSVSWKDLGVDDPQKDSSWSYKVPKDDGKYEYKIGYTTSVEVTDSIANKQVNNSASVSDGGPSTNGSATVPAGFDFQVSKKATAVSATGATWQIDVTVPKGGYKTLEVTDSFPMATINGRNLYDRLVDGSIQVSGLRDGETYSVEQVKTPDGTDVSGVKLTFYRNEGKTQTGLGSTDGDRTITITLDTTFNKDWTGAVDNGTAADWQKTHTNNASATANGVKKDASAQVTPPTAHQSLSKGGSYAGTVKIGGVDCPVYRYELTLSGVSDEDLDIYDTFDTNVLAYCDPSQHQDLNAWDAAQVFGGDQWSQSNRGSEPATITPEANGVLIHVSKDALPRTSMGLYSHYKIVYYLVVNGQDALARLKQQAVSNGGTTQLNNSAAWGDQRAEKSIDYTYDLLTKDLTKAPNPDEGDRTAQYTLSLNPDGMDVNPNGDTITLTDVMTNQELDVSSIKMDPSANTSYNYDAATKTLTVTFPDNTTETLTYTTTVTGTGNVEYSNTASLGGQTKSVQRAQSFSHGGAGAASIPRVRLLKHAEGDLTKTLEGARFELFEAKADGSIDKSNPVKGKNGAVSFTSGKDGIVNVRGRQDSDGWTLEEGRTYYLVETEAPKGYQLDSTPIKFTITDTPTKDGEHVSGFTIDVANKPAEKPGPVLPGLGGSGTTALYAVGGLLVLVGGLGLVRRHRTVRS